MEKLVKHTNGQWELIKSVSSLESKLKAHKDVSSVSVQHNHPDHPGHTYVNIEYAPEASDHVDKHLKSHGTTNHESVDSDSGVISHQAIIKPHHSQGQKIH